MCVGEPHKKKRKEKQEVPILLSSTSNAPPVNDDSVLYGSESDVDGVAYVAPTACQKRPAGVPPTARKKRAVADVPPTARIICGCGESLATKALFNPHQKECGHQPPPPGKRLNSSLNVGEQGDGRGSSSRNRSKMPRYPGVDAD